MIRHRLESVSALTAAAIVLLASAVAADTSLWIPDTDPQPISAGIVGVGADGRTTWQIQQGTATGSETTFDGGFPGTATLVEGPSDAVLSLAMTADPAEGGFTFNLDLSCTISSSIAVCVGTDTMGTVLSTDTQTETVSPFLVQGGGSVSQGATNPAASRTTAASSTRTASSSQASAGSTPASSSAQATGTTAGKNAALRHRVTGGGIIGIAAAVVCTVYVM